MARTMYATEITCRKGNTERGRFGAAAVAVDGYGKADVECPCCGASLTFSVCERGHPRRRESLRRALWILGAAFGLPGALVGVVWLASLVFGNRQSDAAVAASQSGATNELLGMAVAFAALGLAIMAVVGMLYSICTLAYELFAKVRVGLEDPLLNDHSHSNLSHCPMPQQGTTVRDVLAVGTSGSVVGAILGPPSAEASGASILAEAEAAGANTSLGGGVAGMLAREFPVWDRPEGKYELVFERGRLSQIHSAPSGGVLAWGAPDGAEVSSDGEQGPVDEAADADGASATDA